MTAGSLPVTLTPLLGFPEVREGDDVAEMVLNALQDTQIQLMDGDVLVISSKIVSKAMGLRAPADQQAEVVLSQTVRIVAERMTPSGVTRIVESAAGPVMTAAGVDASNTADPRIVLILPTSPDAVAAQIREGVQTGWAARSGTHPVTGVILSDTAGRPWRNGQTDFALGASGIHAIEDLRGTQDTDGRVLSVAERCLADELASAADLVKGKTSRVPVAHIRGLGRYVGDSEPPSCARDLVRTGAQDWFRFGRVEAVRAALGVEPGSAAASEVGIPFLIPEGPATRAERALRVALLTCPDATAELDGKTISIVATDEFTLGVAATRAQVALHGEGLSTSLTRSVAAALTVDGQLTSQPYVLIVFQ